MINRQLASNGDDNSLLITGVVGEAVARLAAAGVATPRVDAELLLAHVLGLPRRRLPLVDTVDPDQAAAFRATIDRRVTREPLQHITGTAAFRHVELAVGPGVLVPRPETELLVDAVLPALGPGRLAVDLCAGSGALAIALAHEVPGLHVAAVENEPAALAWLVRNTAQTTVQVERGDVTAGPVLPGRAGRADAVVSNPPYVPAATRVAPEVGADPAVAVFAGPDGLAVIPHVIDRAAELLHAGGIFAMEHDDSHGTAVPALLQRDRRWTDVTGHRDLSGRPRYVVAQRA